MEGISINGRHLKITTIEVKTEPAGIWISGTSDTDETAWVCVFITPAALFEMINMPHVLPGQNAAPVPPFIAEDYDVSGIVPPPPKG